MSLKITKAGLLDTIQDVGRTGYRHVGINPSGAMDKFSAQLCNALLGKPLKSAVLEMHFPAADILFQESTIVCLSGGYFSALINERPVPLHQPFVVAASTQLRFKGLVSGARCYLSLLHDLGLVEWLQSTSTNLKANAGGWEGRSLKKDDCIPFKKGALVPSIPAGEAIVILPWKADPPPVSNIIFCTTGNEWNWLTVEAQDKFENASFLISNLSDRMGYRLSGEALTRVTKDELVSSAVDFGTVQLLPNGQLIILMADHQTTGGYPRVAHISAVSLSSLAQMKPNDKIHFQFISLQQAEDDLLQQIKYLDQLRHAAEFKIENFLHASL